ncbi:NAD(P)/FAD-dependent oxidoreductase [Phenylobacterium sp.]|uniref:NAD(P)/FAD-dependent oxidoreductase n=1 Tax=Phenylobacterium sp. TaxID=1871053 RepID=UPI002E3823DE|nr:NAD(P)/FAD-dependent oxidoreductase [Phenylobacterium sp.]HEX3364159.1 NAD(P)/FAD-dependent oxidoreductase [Phenylobacterium sp.]
MTPRDRPAGSRPQVVIVGAGFAGVAAAKALKHADVDVLLLDRRNHHIFQPLLYQVATAVLAPSDVATPIRALAATQPNLTVQLAEVTAVSATTRTLTAALPDNRTVKIGFDYLVVATGVRPSYFGHDEFAAYAPALKTLGDAEAIRSKILSAFELAELSDDAVERGRLTTFVLVGGGPTGVELAASIAQMAKVTLKRDFRRLHPDQTKVILLEGGDRILPTFDPKLSAAARRQLERLGVSVRTGAVAQAVDADGVVVAGARVPAATVLWTAGVAASPLAAQTGAPTDRAGRAQVGPLLETEAGSGIFVAGDTASLSQDGKPVPGVAQAALQQGAYVGGVIASRVGGHAAKPAFHYFNKGTMAVVGKDFAILESSAAKTSGRLTWLVWALVHIATLPRLQNQLRVNVQWLWSYFTGQRGSRLIAEPATPQQRAAQPVVRPDSLAVGQGRRPNAALSGRKA